MENFLKWLIIGLVIIAFAYLLGGINTNVSSSNPNPVNKTPTPLVESSVQEQGYVGKANIIASKTIWLKDFNTTKDVGNQIFSVEDQKIYNGLLFGKKYILFKAHPDLDNYVSSNLEFYVSRTNRYGPMKIMINNFIIGDDIFDVGKYTIPLNKTWLKNETTIEIYPESSSWRIWAPTVYDISGASLIVNRYYARPYEFRFNISENINKFRGGKIRFNLLNSAGKLEVYLNGNLIYNSTPNSSSFDVYFNSKDVKSGENVLLLKASENGLCRGSAFIDVEYLTNEIKKVEKDVYFDGIDYDRLLYKNGRIAFHIKRVYNSGGLVLRIINSQGKETFHKYEEAKTGFFEYDIDQGLVSIGDNKFIIESIDGGAFDVDEFEIYKT